MAQKDKWAKLTAVGLCMREREVDGKLTREEHYFIGSRDMPAAGYARALRDHWGIENTCHWTLDVAFREDQNRVSGRQAAVNLALVRRLALSLIKQHKGKGSVPCKRLAAALDTDLLEEILQIR